MLAQSLSEPQARVTRARALPVVVRTPSPLVALTLPVVSSTKKTVMALVSAITLPSASGLTDWTDKPVSWA